MVGDILSCHDAFEQGKAGFCVAMDTRVVCLIKTGC